MKGISQVISHSLTSSNTSMSRDKLIKHYFHCGFSYSLIVCCLFFIHGVSISLRQLKRILKHLNLRRRYTPNVAHLRQLEVLIREELKGSGSLLGYRSMWRRLQNKYGFHIPRHVVMWFLKNIAPEDSNSRKRHRLTRRTYCSKGPNYVWHTDGMDKLKPYGFAVHGCIDGYSRRVLWLTVGVTNNNPEIIAYYFLKYVQEINGVPKLLRSDCGSENANLAFIQPFLRRNDNDCFSGLESFRYGRSTTNQRIEAWWSHLKRQCTQWWCTLFKRMEQSGLYNNTNFVHVDCLRLCFMHLIQRDLDHIQYEWNAHPIRLNRSTDSPPGHPDVLYYMPEILGTEDYVCPIDRRDLATVCEYATIPEPPGSLEFLEMAKQIMGNDGLLPETVEEALNLYTLIVSTIEQRY